LNVVELMVNVFCQKYNLLSPQMLLLLESDSLGKVAAPQPRPPPPPRVLLSYYCLTTLSAVQGSIRSCEWIAIYVIYLNTKHFNPFEVCIPMSNVDIENINHFLYCLSRAQDCPSSHTTFRIPVDPFPQLKLLEGLASITPCYC